MDNKLNIQRIHANQLLGFTKAGGLQAQTETEGTQQWLVAKRWTHLKCQLQKRLQLDGTQEFDRDQTGWALDNF